MEAVQRLTSQDVARANDLLRVHRQANQFNRIVLTQGIHALGEDAIREIMDLVRDFDDFSEDNDPHGEHDCALFDWNGRRLMWKIDYYDGEYKYGSDPYDPTTTTGRLLTVLLAEEY